MPSSPASSPGSAPCRLEWRPSRWLQAALAALGGLAGASLLLCELPLPAAWPLALLAWVHGLRLAWREGRRRRRELVLAPAAAWQGPGGGPAGYLDGQPLQAWEVAWRGPLAFLSLLDMQGRRIRLAWWPDTLAARARRELRLAAASAGASRRRQAVAP